MKNWPRLIVICISFSFLSMGAKAMVITGSRAQVLENMLFSLMHNYMHDLKTAGKSDQIENLNTSVELESPWYKMIKAAQETQDWHSPKFTDGKYSNYSYPWKSLQTICNALDKQKNNIKIIQSDNNLYDYILDGARVTVRYDDGMKLYSFELR